ncbi:MAG: flagellin, partial [Pseudomonadota bacterium]
MASILTNNSAMVALNTLRTINNDLQSVQSEISTGLRVGQAKDNAAIFAISQVMRSDVEGFESLSESLSLGSSTVAVASNAANSIAGSLNEIKGKIVAANGDNVDKQTLQDEIESLVSQIGSVVGAAQLNGLNLIDGSAGASLNVLSSLDRDSTGTVTASNITVDLSGTNLSTTTGTAVAAVFDAAQVGANGAASGFSAAIDESGGTTEDLDITFDSGVAPTAGSVYSVSIGDTEFSYVAQTGDDNLVVAYNLRDQIQNSGLDVTASVTSVVDPTATDVDLNIKNDDLTTGLTIAGDVTSAGSGALSGLSAIDVVTNAAGALDTIETAIKAVNGAQATF